MNIPYGIPLGVDEDRIEDPGLRLAHCHDARCSGRAKGFLFFAETELCPFCGGESWS
jgi:hypothetical protein